MEKLIEKYRAWRARYLFKRQQEKYMERTGGDQKCPHCAKWMSELGGWAKSEVYEQDRMLDLLTCRCGGQSTWLFAVGLILIDKIPKSEKPNELG